ncbi:MAG: nitroreductase family protein [Spirochaetota bacterium]
MEVIEAIKTRRSIRHYTSQPVTFDSITHIIEAGIWAPSGLNNQPWRFVIVQSSDKKEELSYCTSYGRIIQESQVCICVFYHIASGYNRDKDILGIGACIQNMLLAAYDKGLGAVWLGEILNKKQKVNDLCGLSNEYELMAVIAVGYPNEKGNSTRHPLEHFIVKTL